MKQNQNHTAPPAQNPVIPFNYQTHQVRTIRRPDKSIWFITKDVCGILGLRDVNKATIGLDEDEKGTNKVPTPGGEQSLSIISESGLYTLIIRSNKPEARPFRKWVTSEVLPAIRQNGAYVPAGARIKTCSACGKTKCINLFYRDSKSPDGRKSQCKVCHNKTAKPAPLPEPPDTIADAVAFGALAATRLMERLHRSGRNMNFVRKLARYRNMGLSQRETAILMGATRDVIRPIETLAAACGLCPIEPARPTLRIPGAIPGHNPGDPNRGHKADPGDPRCHSRRPGHGPGDPNRGRAADSEERRGHAPVSLSEVPHE